MALRHDEGLNSRMSWYVVKQSSRDEAKRQTLPVKSNLTPHRIIISHQQSINRRLATAALSAVYGPRLSVSNGRHA